MRHSVTACSGCVSRPGREPGSYVRHRRLAAWSLVPEADEPDASVTALQQAALEAVRAARAMLDAAESVIREPAALEAVVDDLGTLAAKAVSGLRSAVVQGERAGPGAAGPEGDDGFERITVD